MDSELDDFVLNLFLTGVKLVIERTQCAHLLFELYVEYCRAVSMRTLRSWRCCRYIHVQRMPQKRH